MEKRLNLFSIFDKKDLSLIEFVTYSLGLGIGILVLIGIILSELKLFSVTLPIKILFITILSLLSILFFINLRFFIKDKKENTKFLIIFCLSLAIPIITFLISKFPATDFWAYHAKNIFLWNFLLPIKQTFVNWVPFWHIGYPLLQMYAPGTHILVIISTLITGLPVIFNDILINIVSYIFTVLAFYVFVSRFSNKKIAFISSVLLIFFARFINEVFIQGHHTNFLALGFGFLGLSIIGLKERTKIDHLLFVFFMFLCLIFHHSLFALLALSFFITFLFIDIWRAIKIALGLFISILLAGFWLFPALIEQVYWADTLTGFNPIFIYLVSLGPFILLALYGLFKLFKKYKVLSYFTTVLAFLSIIPVVVFPYLPLGLARILNKVFIGRFKATILTSILLLVFLSYGFFKIIKSIKFKKIGYFLLILWFIFSGLLINVYLRQDGIKLIEDNGIITKDSCEKLYLFDNYERLKPYLTDNKYRYYADPNILPLLFNVSGVKGSMGPRPRRDYIITPKEYNDYLSFVGAKIFITQEDLISDEYEFLFNLGNCTEKIYDFSFSMFKNPIKYFLEPEKFPTKIEIHNFKVYRAKNVRPVIEIPEFKPVIYLGRLNEEELILKKYYKIPLLQEKIETGLEVNNILDIKPIEFNGKNTLDYNIGIEKISINLEKSDKKVPIYIKINYSPHWKAYDEDGNKLKIYRTFTDLMLIEVANTNTVELIWEKTTYDLIGSIISIIGLILLIILLI